MISIEKVDSNLMQQIIAPLAVMLKECVEQGASIGFVMPFNLQQSSDFWEAKHKQKCSGHKIELFVAKVEGVVAGCVMLDLETPANQSHRADVAKLLVHPNYQRRGIAIQLMLALEKQALLSGRSLLVLDTKTGDNAESLYLKMGFEISGSIPNFAQNPALDGYAATTFMYKNLKW